MSNNNSKNTGGAAHEYNEDLGKPQGEEFCSICKTAIGTCPECIAATVTVNEICARTRTRRQSVYAKAARKGFPVRKKKPDYIPIHVGYTDNDIDLMQRAVDAGFSVSDARSILRFQDSNFSITDCKNITRLSDTGFILYEKGRGGGKAYRVFTSEEARILESSDGRKQRGR